MGAEDSIAGWSGEAEINGNGVGVAKTSDISF
jgi:hypothetical protein